MKSPFGIDNNIIDEALRYGILIEVNGKWVDQIGVLSLVYHTQLRRYVFVFGTTAQNASFVLLEDEGKTWRVKPHA